MWSFQGGVDGPPPPMFERGGELDLGGVGTGQDLVDAELELPTKETSSQHDRPIADGGAVVRDVLHLDTVSYTCCVGLIRSGYRRCEQDQHHDYWESEDPT